MAFVLHSLRKKGRSNRYWSTASFAETDTDVLPKCIPALPPQSLTKQTNTRQKSQSQSDSFYMYLLLTFGCPGVDPLNL